MVLTWAQKMAEQAGGGGFTKASFREILKHEQRSLSFDQEAREQKDYLFGMKPKDPDNPFSDTEEDDAPDLKDREGTGKYVPPSFRANDVALANERKGSIDVHPIKGSNSSRKPRKKKKKKKPEVDPWIKAVPSAERTTLSTAPFRCTLCNVQLNGKGPIQDHCNGQKHKAALQQEAEELARTTNEWLMNLIKTETVEAQAEDASAVGAAQGDPQGLRPVHQDADKCSHAHVRTQGQPNCEIPQVCCSGKCHQKHQDAGPAIKKDVDVPALLSLSVPTRGKNNMERHDEVEMPKLSTTESWLGDSALDVEDDLCDMLDILIQGMDSAQGRSESSVHLLDEVSGDFLNLPCLAAQSSFCVSPSDGVRGIA